MDLWQRFADGWHDALLAFDRSLQLVAVNAPAAALFDSTPAALAGRRLRAVSPKAADVLEQLVARAFDERNVFANDLRPFGGDEPFTVMTHRLSGDEAVALTLHRERDGDWPTDTGWAHRELAFANRMLQAYTDNTRLGFVRCDHELRIVEWSARASAIFGWTFDEVRGRTAEELGLIYAADVPAVDEIKRALREGAVTTNVSENRNLTKDGRVIHCRWFNSVLPIDGSHQIVSQVDDVTDQVRIRAAAAENEQRFRSVFTCAADGMLLLDPSGTITHANAAAQRMFGAPSSSLVGRAYYEMVAEESAWIGRSSFGRVVLGETVADSLRMRRFDGTTFPVTASIAPMRVGFRVAGAVATLKDMSAFVEATASLEASEERFRSLFDYSPDAMLALSLSGEITRANAAAARNHGYAAEELVGRHATELLVPADVRAALEAFRQAAHGNAITFEATAQRGDGTTFPVLATLIPIVFRGAIAGVHLLARDMTAIHRAEGEVLAQSSRLRELYLVAASANATAENLIASTIDAGCRLLGMSAGSLYDAEADRSVATVGEPIPRRLARLALATDGALAIEDLNGLPYLAEPEFGESAPLAYVGTAIEVAGSLYGTLSFAAPAPRPEAFKESDRDLVQLMGALVGSAIERGRSRARLKHLAYNDQLTALPNRAWFTERLRDELALAGEAGTRVAVMFLDLDRFKDINDALGHDRGDTLLQEVATRLKGVLRATDTISRLGGDEFAVVSTDAKHPDNIVATARKILASLEGPFSIGDKMVETGASIGIAMYPLHGDDPSTLLRRADVAMYVAKRAGGGFMVYSPEQEGQSLRHSGLGGELRRSMTQAELVLHYQPIVLLPGRKPYAVEALVRWNHPREGLLPPDRFISIAEETSMIGPLTGWVLDTALAQLCRWLAAGIDISVAVNVSPRTLEDHSIVDDVARALAATKAEPSRLTLEISESVAMSSAAAKAMHRLHDIGVRLSLDDFGTGYSSLVYLKRLPVQEIKVDRSFVKTLPSDPDASAIVRSAIGLGHNLGMRVIAEGVEAADAEAMLVEAGCDAAQGFLIGKPEPEAQLGEVLRVPPALPR
ncbi:MAG: EAL domain-containing protein [Candidatus Eremiobacteraeota bacterium]|nr:EAL domain-containing protein [Candidatus Eremiobacteraeota bacterium]